MNSISISTVTQNDLEEFWQLFSEVLQSDFPGYSKKVLKFFLEKLYTRTAYMYWIVHSMKTIYLAKENGKVVGFAVIDQPYGGVSFCRWLGVRPTHQRKGIGSALIQKWISAAKSVGCHKVELAAQPTAREFYKKVGLIEEGTREKSYFGIDQYVFGKVIGQPQEQVMIAYN